MVDHAVERGGRRLARARREHTAGGRRTGGDEPGAPEERPPVEAVVTHCDAAPPPRRPSSSGRSARRRNVGLARLAGHGDHAVVVHGLVAHDLQVVLARLERPGRDARHAGACAARCRAARGSGPRNARDGLRRFALFEIDIGDDTITRSSSSCRSDVGVGGGVDAAVDVAAAVDRDRREVPGDRRARADRGGDVGVRRAGATEHHTARVVHPHRADPQRVGRPHGARRRRATPTSRARCPCGRSASRRRAAPRAAPSTGCAAACRAAAGAAAATRAPPSTGSSRRARRSGRRPPGPRATVATRRAGRACRTGVMPSRRYMPIPAPAEVPTTTSAVAGSQPLASAMPASTPAWNAWPVRPPAPSTSPMEDIGSFWSRRRPRSGAARARSTRPRVAGRWSRRVPRPRR